VYEPIAGNYYPLTAAMYVQDAAAHKQLAVLTDRSQGGASLKSGEMEVRQGGACVIFYVFCVLCVDLASLVYFPLIALHSPRHINAAADPPAPGGGRQSRR